ncbi:MAG TPA: hypothetical protein VMS55_08610 [Myxococcota bacterium]|nr:hypothetical protein [Myxococcota bacterium]
MSLASRRFVLAGAFVLACLASSSAAADPMQVVLKDGSVVIGELVAVQSGRLVIQSSSLGLVHLDEARVASMTPLAAIATPSSSESNLAASAPPVPGATPETEMASMLQSLMATDPELLAQLGKLQESELMKEILADPDLMAKVRAGDYAALGQDPRIQKLLSDPSVRSIQERVGE